MNWVYLIIAVLALVELKSIGGSVRVIAAAYVVWARGLEKDANPLIVLKDDEPQGRPEAPA